MGYLIPSNVLRPHEFGPKWYFHVHSIHFQTHTSFLISICSISRILLGRCPQVTWQPSLTGNSRCDEIAQQKLTETFVRRGWGVPLSLKGEGLQSPWSWYVTISYDFNWSMRSMLSFARVDQPCRTQTPGGFPSALVGSKCSEETSSFGGAGSSSGVGFMRMMYSSAPEKLQACRLLWEEAPEEVQESQVALKAMAALPRSSGLVHRLGNWSVPSFPDGWGSKLFNWSFSASEISNCAFPSNFVGTWSMSNPVSVCPRYPKKS